MTSKAEALFVCKSFGPNLLPNASPEVAIATLLKKKQGDATFSLQFSDATLRDPRSGKGLVVAAEKPLAEGVKGIVAYNVEKQDTIASVTIDKTISGHATTLKAQYQLKGDIFTLQETWKFDKNNKVTGIYNFQTEEAAFSLEHVQGPLKLTGLYNLKTDKAVLSAERKQGLDTLTVTYGIKDEAAALTWQRKPFKAILKSKAGKGGFRDASLAFAVIHEFEL